MKTCKLVLFCSACCLSSVLFAQSNMQSQAVKQRLISELKISSIKADSVVNYLHDFNQNIKSIKGNTNLKEDQRNLALQKEKQQEAIILRSQLTDAQVKQVMQMMQEPKGGGGQQKAMKDSTSSTQQ